MGDEESEPVPDLVPLHAEPEVGVLAPLPVLRAVTALAGAPEATHRDLAGQRRDRLAQARDQVALGRDRAAERRESAIELEGASLELRRVTAALRAAAALDRARAAGDRKRAAEDRAQAAADRHQAQIDLALAHLDGMTGAYTRRLGERILRHEIDRARRQGEAFTLALMDVDGLKEVNDELGHAAGDTLLRSVTQAIRLKLRSYDPLVRMGGDEFICGFTGTGSAAARRRADEIRDTVDIGPLHTTISVGLAGLEPGDTLEDLIRRGNAELNRNKRRTRA